jgi:hypothetical protein
MRVLAFATIFVSLAAAAPGQSLSDAARQEAGKRARRGETAKLRSFTDSDLTHGAPERTEVVGAPTPSQSEPAPKATSSVDPVRAELDREAERRHQKEVTWREYMASVTMRFELAKHDYELACGPKAIDMAGG